MKDGRSSVVGTIEENNRMSTFAGIYTGVRLCACTTIHTCTCTVCFQSPRRRIVYKSNGDCFEKLKSNNNGNNKGPQLCRNGGGAFVYAFKPGTLTIEGQQSQVGVESPVLFCVQNQ